MSSRATAISKGRHPVETGPDGDLQPLDNLNFVSCVIEAETSSRCAPSPIVRPQLTPSESPQPRHMNEIELYYQLHGTGTRGSSNPFNGRHQGNDRRKTKGNTRKVEPNTVCVGWVSMFFSPLKHDPFDSQQRYIQMPIIGRESFYPGWS